MTSQLGLKQHKQEIPLKSVKQQHSYFSQLHHRKRTLCNKFHAHWIHIFTMKNSIRIQHLFKINSKLQFPTRSLCNQYFSQVVHYNTRPTKLESHFYHFPSSSFAFYKIGNIQKAFIQPYFILPEKYQNQYISYFYQILNFMRNPTKLGSLHLDTYSSRYDFSKLHKILERNKTKPNATTADTRDPVVKGPRNRHTEAGEVV